MSSAVKWDRFGKDIAPGLESALEQRRHRVGQEVTQSLTQDDIRQVAAEEVLRLSSSQKTPLSTPFQGMWQTIEPLSVWLSELKPIPTLLAQIAQFDNYTLRHSLAVSVISAWIGRCLRLSEADIQDLAIAGALHDIGKVDVGREIINKPGVLSAHEYEVVKKHTVFGYERLYLIDSLPALTRYAALLHHERNDGSGYPFGFGAYTSVSKGVQIISVVDVFHAMLSDRSYTKGKDLIEVLRVLEQEAGSKLNHDITSVLLENMMHAVVGEHIETGDERVVRVMGINASDPLAPLVETNIGYEKLTGTTLLRIAK